MPVLKVETDIITSIAASLIGTYVILVIIYVEPYKTIDNIKMGSAAAFVLIYIYSLELYPTVVRNGGIELSSCVGRIGSMLAPYVAQSVRFFYQCLKKRVAYLYIFYLIC
jgi:hypothetical protein